MVLRRAKALAHLLDNKALYILPNERIVGNITSEPDCIHTYPELFSRWLDRAIDKQYAALLDDDKRQRLHEVHKYWLKKSFHGMERNFLPEEVRKYWRYDDQGAFYWIHGGHVGTPNYDKVFKVGLKGIIKQCEDRLKEISSDPNIYLNGREYLKQRNFLEAAIITLEAVSRLGKRFSNLAKEMAKKEEDERRKRELEELGEICDWVPGNPPHTFHEALQCYWFINLVTRILDLQSSGNGERLDQIFYPFYKRDKEEGRITREEAEELMEHLILKANEEGGLIPPGFGWSGGVTITRVSTIGGQTHDGEDATNEVTYIILDAKNAIGLVQPASIAVRLHRRTPEALLRKVAESLRLRSGAYSFFNDEEMIPYLLNFGIPLRDARDYSTDGCMRWMLPGKAMAHRALGGTMVLPKCLEYALYQGVDKFTGKQIGAKTPNPSTFTSIEDVIQAYLEQLRFFTEKHVAIYNIVDALEEEYLPQPFLSALLDGCIEHGRDCREYKYFPNTVVQPVGQVTVANALAAMKKLVFDEKKVSMEELLEALRKNWEGKEDLRRMCLNCPKFGNDDDYVDLLARDVFWRSSQVTKSFKNIWGYPFMEDGTSGSNYWIFSGFTGATPDGRKDRDVFNDGTISPVVGTDVNGPTAVLNSVAKIDHADGNNTHLFNQKFSPQFLAGDYEPMFVDYLRTWVDLGIHHIQFNAQGRETLLDAQEHPEKHQDLIVRVAGYAAYFVDLEKTVQDSIIARTEQDLETHV
mgnify:CR=1 FL=1